MEITHADFSKVTGMVFIKVCSVMVLTTGKTATSWMFTMFSDSTVAVTDMATVFSCVAQSCRHCRWFSTDCGVSAGGLVIRRAVTFRSPRNIELP